MNKNEETGIFTIIIIVLFSIVALCYFLGYFSTSHVPANTPVHLEVPAPPVDKNPGR